MTTGVDWRRLLLVGLSAIVASACGIYGREWIVDNSDARNMIATIFSILAGFLIAVIAMAADERQLRGGTWRHDYVALVSIRNRLNRHKLTFALYLGVLLIDFILTLKVPLPAVVAGVLDQIMLGLAVFAFLLSFRLPGLLMSEHMKTLELRMESHKAARTKGGTAE